jgi:hypothetical protein
MNIERATADGHPEPDLLRAFARLVDNSDKIYVIKKFPAYIAAKK